MENYGKSIEIKKQQLESLEASVDSATKLFQNARAEYMDVLLAQRDLMEARMVLIETKQQQLSAIVNAYQALGGGGWLPNGFLMTEADCPPTGEEIPLAQPFQLRPDSELIPTPTTQESTQPDLPQGTELPMGTELPKATELPTGKELPPLDPSDMNGGGDSSLRVLPPPEPMADTDPLEFRPMSL